MPILNYTTTISADKTVGEIQAIISKRGASKVMIDYENGQPAALCFQIHHNGQPVSFRLPANKDGVLSALNKQRVPAKLQTRDQALRVCWRIIKDWVQAQMAIIEAEQASLATVFLPYAITQNGQTVSENLLNTEADNQLLLH